MSYVAAPLRSWLPALLTLGALSICGCQQPPRLPGPPADFDSPARVARGRALFLEHCVLCHGERADGNGPRRQNFDRPPRDFTSRSWRQGATPSGVFQAIRQGVDRSPMPSWSSLPDDQLWALTAYVLSVAPPPGSGD